MINSPIAILVVDRDEARFAQIATLLQQANAAPPRLQRLADGPEALHLMAANDHDLYLIVSDENLADPYLLVKQSLAKGCQGPIILIRTEQLQPDEEAESMLRALKAGAAEQLFWDELTVTLLNHTIQRARTRALMQTKLRESQIRLMDSHEQEQALLSRQLHEGPLQDLIGMRFYLGIASDVVESVEAKEQLAFVQQNLQEVIDSLRSLCVDLRPPALSPFGLEKAIRAEIGRFRNRHPNVEIISELDSDELLLSTRIRLVLYRIFQHALLNIVQHAQATLITIRFSLDESRVRLTIHDDGHGFLLPDHWLTFASEGRCGLLEAEERVLNVNGDFQVESILAPNPLSGTTISVTIPI